VCVEGNVRGTINRQVLNVAFDRKNFRVLQICKVSRKTLSQSDARERHLLVTQTGSCGCEKLGFNNKRERLHCPLHSYSDKAPFPIGIECKGIGDTPRFDGVQECTHARLHARKGLDMTGKKATSLPGMSSAVFCHIVERYLRTAASSSSAARRTRTHELWHSTYPRSSLSAIVFSLRTSLLVLW